MTERVVYKYSLDANHGRVLVPYPNPKLLKVAIQHGQFQAWFEHDVLKPGQAKKLFHFMVIGTGHETSLAGYQFFDTIFHDQFVWHIYLREQSIV